MIIKDAVLGDYSIEVRQLDYQLLSSTGAKMKQSVDFNEILRFVVRDKIAKTNASLGLGDYVAYEEALYAEIAAALTKNKAVPKPSKEENNVSNTIDSALATQEELGKLKEGVVESESTGVSTSS